MAISVLVCVGNSAEKLLPKIQERIAVLKVGNGLEAASQMGPLITRQHLDKVTSYVNQGEKDGAKVLVDGRTLKVPGHEKGFFLGPCLLDQVTPNMTVYREEIFGPVLSVVRVDTYDQAVALIHAHPYGNGTAIFTNDGGAARKFQHEIQVGMVGISYPGISQLFVAATQPPSLNSITPLSVLDDSYRATLYPGGILNTGFAVTWSSERAKEAQPFGQAP